MAARRWASSIASQMACAPKSIARTRRSLPNFTMNASGGRGMPAGGAVNKFSTGANGADGAERINGQNATKSPNGVNVTQTRSSDDASATSTPFLHTDNESMELVDGLLQRTSQMMDPHAANVVAYSGGVDSSLVAALVHRAFSDRETGSLLRTPSSSTSQTTTNDVVDDHDHRDDDGQGGSIQAVLGISPAVPRSQIAMARRVADAIGIPLTEVTTAEGSDEAYRRNDGYACYVCKTHLYSTLETVANAVMEQQRLRQQQQQQHRILEGNASSVQTRSVILYNGTNADDTQDPTRLGLVAASNFRVHSPLDHVTKDQVRRAARYLGLPNWDAAASPCLRSRLAMGVMATEEHLRAVEMAEEFVRAVLGLDGTVNARVRMLSGGKAMVELDSLVFEAGGEGGGDWATSVLREHGFEQRCIDEWGFKSFGGVRGFKTGSVAAMPTDDSQPLPSAAL